MEKNSNIIHQFQIDNSKSSNWRQWGYSKQLEPFDYKTSDYCALCNTSTGVFYKTVCHCGSAHASSVSKSAFITSSRAENGDSTFYCCQDCTKKITEVVKNENGDLLNHEILIKIIRQLKT
jgi:hypothetical protein